MQKDAGTGVRRLMYMGLAGAVITLAGLTVDAVGHGQASPEHAKGNSGIVNARAVAEFTPTRQQLKQRYIEQHDAARIVEGPFARRVVGSELGTGDTPAEAAQQAMVDIAPLFGARAEDMVAGARHLPPGQSAVPAMHDPATGQPKFTVVYHQQMRSGIPVYGARVTTLVRNVPGNPVVLVNPDVRELGGLQVAADQAGVVATPAGQDNAIAFAGAGAVVESAQRVIWAGLAGKPEPATLADEMIVVNGFDKWRIIADADTGRILHTEFLIHFGQVNGTAEGNASDGPGTADCEPEILKPLPYVRFTDPFGGESFTDANGEFTAGSGQSLTFSLDGMWFDVFNFIGGEVTESVTANPPLEVVFGEGGASEEVQSQINAYVESNVIRDFVLAYNPTYPTLNNPDFTVTVNRTDGFCPSNAWYDSSQSSINFCLSGGSSAPNTAWSSVVYHEYGHHLVQAGGSGQGQYGEGMGDTMSTIILDDNRLGLGFFGSCSESLRDADNLIQYPCSDSIHFCGQLLSGCVWDTRNELVASGVSNYIDVLANLSINSILLHNGSSITPQIAVDFLTLDDDNGDLSDGSPHYAEIAAGFRGHNMLPADLETVRIEFPNGLATHASPDGTTTIQAEVIALDGNVVPGSTVMNVDTGGGFQAIAMTNVGGDLYEASFPGTPCGTPISYFFTAESTSGVSVNAPGNAPGTTFAVTSAYSEGELRFADNFESDQGWSVSTSASDGPWERGVPANNGRGDPPADADGSGQCYLTDNNQFDSNSDVDSGATTLTSPIMDASGGNVVVSYWRWFSNDSGDGPNTDPFTVEVSDNGGSSWQTLEIVGPSGPGTSGGWIPVQFRIRFTAEDNDPQSIVEAGVDGVELRRVDCEPPVEPCPADIAEGDNEVNVFDLLDLLGGWGSSGPGADLAEPNDVIDVFDLLELLSAWGSCPQ